MASVGEGGVGKGRWGNVVGGTRESVALGLREGRNKVVRRSGAKGVVARNGEW